MSSTLDDITYLARTEHRIPTLVELAVRPRSRTELCELGDVSSSTMRRTLREFEDRNWVRRNDYKYETTELGASIASATADLIERIEAVRQVRGVWDCLPGDADGFSLEHCTDSKVTVAESDDPYRPVERFQTLLEESDTLRAVGFELAIFEPCKESLCQQAKDGMQIDLIVPPHVADYIRRHCSELVSDTLGTGNLTLRLHNNLPDYGVCIFDERISIRGYDSDGVTLRVILDTDNPDAIDWAESVYDTYYREKPMVPLKPAED